MILSSFEIPQPEELLEVDLALLADLRQLSAYRVLRLDIDSDLKLVFGDYGNGDDYDHELKQKVVEAAKLLLQPMVEHVDAPRYTVILDTNRAQPRTTQRIRKWHNDGLVAGASIGYRGAIVFDGLPTLFASGKLSKNHRIARDIRAGQKISPDSVEAALNKHKLHITTTRAGVIYGIDSRHIHKGSVNDQPTAMERTFLGMVGGPKR